MTDLIVNFVSMTKFAEVRPMMDLVAARYERHMSFYKAFAFLLRRPNWVRKLASKLLITANQPRLAMKIKGMVDKDFYELNKTHQIMNEWKQMYDKKW